MRFLTLAFDLFNSRQSFYILCPLWDTDADSLQGFPRYTSLHHPLANVSKSRGYIRDSEGAFFGCTCLSKGGCFPLKSTLLFCSLKVSVKGGKSTRADSGAASIACSAMEPAPTAPSPTKFSLARRPYAPSGRPPCN